MNIANIRVSSNDLPVRQMLHCRQQLNEKLSLSPDDGYSTDSRSNTTASIYSPLSSSLSSLSTTEGSPHSGSMHPSTLLPQNGGQKLGQMQNIQPGPIQKGPNLHVASKTLLTRKGVIPVKRKGVKVEEEPNLSSLEDRLRALTTIDEEDLGLSKVHRAMNPQTEIDKINQTLRSKNTSSINPLNIRHSKITVGGQQLTPEPDTESMYHQAVPVALTAGSGKNPHPSTADRSEAADREAYFANAYNQLESSDELTKEGWRKYTELLQKQSEIPSKNINLERPRMVSNVDVNGSAVTGLEKCPRIDSSRLYREQDDDRAGVGNYDARSQYLGDQSSHDSGLHQGVDKNGYHSKEYDSTSGRDDRMNLPSYDYPLMPDFQGSLSDTKTHQYRSYLSGQTQPSYTHQQTANYELTVADQYVNVQQSHSREQDISPGYALEDRVSYPPHSYTISTQQHLVASGTPVTGIASRASWQQLGSSFDQQHLSECRRLTHVGLERNSLDLGNIPKLQKQIRAVSDLCLQASRKHMFASSADIHKLFSGQKKQPAPLQHSAYMNDQERDQLSDPGLQDSQLTGFDPQAFQVTQNSFRPKPKLQVIIPPDPVTGKPIPDPFRADHHIHIPPEAWIDVTSVPSSVPHEGDRVYIDLQNQPRSPRSNQDKSQPASADFSTDRSQANCLSSGYSSESELQQIESNAEAIKKIWKTQTMEKVTHYQVQEFQPLQQFLDEASSSERDDYEGLSESNSVYENQSMLTQTHKSSYQPVNSQYFSQNESSSQSTAFLSTAYSTLESYVPTAEENLRKGSSNNSSFNMFRSNSDIVTHNSNNRSICYNQTHFVNSQSEVYGLRNNSTTFTDLQTCPDIHFNRPPLLHSSSIQHHNSAVHHNQQNSPELISYGSTSSLAPPQHPFTPVLSSCSCEDCHKNSTFYWHNRSSRPHVGQPHTQGSHLGYPQISAGSSFVKLPSQEMVDMLNVPFETSVIYSEQGNQLSTLV